MTSRCLEPEDALVLLEPSSPADDAAALHAEVCPECAALVDDLRRVRDVARRLGSSTWADVPPLDVERALRRVRARALLGPAERGGARVPQVLSAAAAAFLLCALVGPYLLRQRVEGDPAGEAGFRPRAERVVFWTTEPTTALALMRD